MILACPHCDHVSVIKSLSDQKRAICPRCKCTLAQSQSNHAEWVMAFSLAVILLLPLSLLPTFITYTQHGLSQTVSLLEAFLLLAEQYSAFLAGLLLFTIVIMPVTVCALLIFSHSKYWLTINSHNARRLARLLTGLLPLNLCDIFLVAVLVSAFKLLTFAEIELGLGFWIYILFVLCFIEAISLVDKEHIWRCQKVHHETSLSLCGNSASQQGLKRCSVCGLVTSHEHCPRCFAKLDFRRKNSIDRSIAWMITAVILIIPANLLPIMDTISLGLHTTATIYSGVVVLWQSGSYPIAILIFTASICIPIAKAIFLFYLAYAAKKTVDPTKTIWIYRALEVMGKWSMIDVFVVIVLVSLVQLGTVLNVEPQAGIVFFTLMVLCQIASVSSFDPRLLWDNKNEQSCSHRR